MLRLPEATRNALLDSIRERIDAAESAGRVVFFSGEQPESADEAPGKNNKILAVLRLSDRCAGPAQDGELTFARITRDSNSRANGTATWARIIDGDGNTIFDCDVDTKGATITLNRTKVVIGGSVALTSFVLRMPAE